MQINVTVPSRIGHYQIKGNIGQGAFSVVKLAFDERNGQYLACKVVPRARIASPELEERFMAEIRIFRQLSHPNIVTLFDLSKDDINFYVFMEFCPNGELFQHIVDAGKLSEKEAKPIVLQLFSALEYIHNKGISHRDMKPENVLVAQDGTIKLSDFGLSRFVGDSGLADTPCGSPCYASPECISGTRYNAITSDVWSTGVIIFAMLTGQLPWTKRNQAQLFKQIRKGEYTVPRFLSPECQDFIRGLMTVDINRRLTIPQARQHPWLRDEIDKKGMKAFSRPTLVSLRKFEDFFMIGNVEELDIDESTLFDNKSSRNMTFQATVKILNKSCLPKIGKHSTHSTSAMEGPPLPVTLIKSKKRIHRVMKSSAVVKRPVRKNSVVGRKIISKR